MRRQRSSWALLGMAAWLAACSASTGGGTATCGNGTVEGAEDCDDGNTADGDGCSSTCRVDLVDTCGDGTLDDGEACDDGNRMNGDGCSATCREESPPPPARCGNGTREGTEACDDGNSDNTDACVDGCVVAACGDGFIRAGMEACDDRNDAADDGCSSCAVDNGFRCEGAPSTCTRIPGCGNSVVEAAESCDDGDNEGGDGCSAACVAEEGWACTGTMPTACTATCGDGLLRGAETCDHGADGPTACCPAGCMAASGCEREPNDTPATANAFDVMTGVSGDLPPGDVDHVAMTVPAGESWSVTVSLAGADGTCPAAGLPLRLAGADIGNLGCQPVRATLPAGVHTWRVDHDPTAGTARVSWRLAVQRTVAPVVCGNGSEEPGEDCDDGNTMPGDGCSAACMSEYQDEVEPNDTRQDGPDALDPAYVQRGTFRDAEDVDTWSITLPEGAVVEVETWGPEGVGSCANTDTTLELQEQDDGSFFPWTRLDTDGGLQRCSRIADMGALEAGTYDIRVKRGDRHASAGYLLRVRIISYCGDGHVDPNERCDSTLHCGARCQSICGDGIQTDREACDDGGNVAGDGCNAACEIETPVMELEPNPISAPQHLGSAPAFISGNIDDTDMDCFSVSLSAVSDLAINLYSPSYNLCDRELFLDMRNAAGTTVLSAPGLYCGRLVPEDLPDMRQLPAGTYTFCVSPRWYSVQWALSVRTTAVCGDGQRTGYEVCDGTPGCGADCRPVAACGDGVVTAPETCDPGSGGATAACDAMCVDTGRVTEREPNDSDTDAQANRVAGTLLAPPSGVATGILDLQDREDRWWFTGVDAGGLSRVSITDVDGTCRSDVRLEVLADVPANAFRLLDPTQGGCATGVLVLPPRSSGVVHVRNMKQLGQPVPYAIRWYAPAEVTETAEPNDMSPQVLPAAVLDDVVVSGATTDENDRDVYTFTTTRTADLRLEALPPPGGGCWDNAYMVTAWTEEGNWLFEMYASNCGYTDGMGALHRDPSAHALPAGTYRLEVRTEPWSTGGQSYRFALMVR